MKASKNQGRKPKSPRINSPRSRAATAPLHTTSPLHGNSKITHPLDINALLHNTDREDSHTLPPGCSVSNIVTSRKRLSEISRSNDIISRWSEIPRSELPHSVKPFSGSGFTLGSGNPSCSRPTATVTNEYQTHDLGNSCYGNRSRSAGETRKDANYIDNLTQEFDNSCYGNRSRSIGVTGKDANFIDNHSVENRTLVPPHTASSTATMGRADHTTGDYVDIQDEDHILQEVILHSAS